MDVLSDIEIARKNQMAPIEKVASKLKLEEDSLQKFGHHIALKLFCFLLIQKLLFLRK